MAKKIAEACELNMTPMIDVVFQLIIFFIVTANFEKENPNIRLPDAVNAPEETKKDNTQLVIEVDNRGYIMMGSAVMNQSQLRKIIRGRYQRFGQFPVMIRGDYRSRHKDIKGVMDACTAEGLWRISFAAVKERKTGF